MQKLCFWQDCFLFLLDLQLLMGGHVAIVLQFSRAASSDEAYYWLPAVTSCSNIPEAITPLQQSGKSIRMIDNLSGILYCRRFLKHSVWLLLHATTDDGPPCPPLRFPQTVSIGNLKSHVAEQYPGL